MSGFVEQLKGKVSNGDWLPFISRLPTYQNEVGLSFDDGPTAQTTPVILKLLRSKGAKATFFLTGERAESSPGLVRDLLAAGHDVFSHGWRHLRYETRLDILQQDLDRAEALLSTLRPTPKPYLVRLPYGSGHMTPAVHRIIRKWNADAQIAHWDDPAEDWKLADNCRSIDQVREKSIAAAAVTAARPNIRGSILLMHDEPYDVTTPLMSQVIPHYLSEVLDGLERMGLRGCQITPIVRRPALHRYIRP